MTVASKITHDTIEALMSRKGRNVQLEDHATEYGERGYTNPERGILFANWNNVPAFIISGLERRGFELEWSDEWVTASHTGKAYRQNADSHGWTPYFVIHEGEVIGGDEIESGAEAEWYVNEILLNDPNHCCVFNINLADFGFTARDETYETGFHPGQKDEPKKVFESLQSEFDVVFERVSSGQFDVSWRVWTRPLNNSEKV